MIRILPFLLLAAAAGCGDRRSFDERFSETENAIEERADRIDRELDNDSGQAEAGEAPSDESR